MGVHAFECCNYSPVSEFHCSACLCRILSPKIISSGSLPSSLGPHVNSSTTTVKKADDVRSEAKEQCGSGCNVLSHLKNNASRVYFFFSMINGLRQEKCRTRVHTEWDRMQCPIRFFLEEILSFNESKP